MKEDILVIGAMKMEIAHIKGATHTGFGKDMTRRKIQEILKNHRPSLVISVGLVGAVNPRLKAGDIFIPDKIIDYANPQYVYKIKLGTATNFPVVKLVAVPNLTNLSGTLVTVHKVFERHHKYELKDIIPDAFAVDMETSAVAEVLEPLGIPLLCVKAVSDELDFDFNDKKELSKNIKLAIKNYSEYISSLWRDVAL